MTRKIPYHSVELQRFKLARDQKGKQKKEDFYVSCFPNASQMKMSRPHTFHRDESENYLHSIAEEHHTEEILISYE